MKFTPILGILFLVLLAPNFVFSDAEESTEINRKIVISLSSNAPTAEEIIWVTIVMLPDRLKIWGDGYDSEAIEISISKMQYIEFERYVANVIAEKGLRVLEGRSKNELNYTHCFVEIVAQERLLGGFNIFDKESFEGIVDKLPGSTAAEFPISKIAQILEQVGGINSESLRSSP